MPVTGPQGQALCSAHEAYNLIGQTRYGTAWQEKISERPVPHLAHARVLAERGFKLPAEDVEFLQADPDESEPMQAQRRREDEVFKDLVNALEWDKTEAWLGPGEWKLIPYWEWYDGTETRPHLVRLLRDDISAVLTHRKPSPNRLLIDQVRLASWVIHLPKRGQPSPLVPVEPKPAHRPRANMDPIRSEFRRRGEGQVEVKRGWRIRLAKYLAADYQAKHPEDARPPKPQTIIKHLRPDFDAFERQLKGG